MAFPFIATVAQFEGAFHQAVHGLGGGRCALQRGAVGEMPDFDRSIRRIDSEIGGGTQGHSVGGSQDGVKLWIANRCHGIQPGPVSVEVLERAVGEIGPESRIGWPLKGVVEEMGMGAGIERDKVTIPSSKLPKGWEGRWAPAGQGRSNGLAEFVVGG